MHKNYIGHIVTVTEDAAATGGEVTRVAAIGAATTGAANKGGAAAMGTAATEEQLGQRKPCEHPQKQQPQE
jgi:hypothetical protein